MYDPEQITFFAKTDARGQQVPFGIRANDRTRHVYVIGKTGMGKSTLLENMAVQDIKNGNGLAFIDPHGQTAETLLDYIPEERKNDVVYFAPFDTDNPVSFNVMEDVGEDKRHLVVSGLMSVFKKIWVDAWSARMEYILSNTLLALLEYPDSTLLGVNRMLSDKDYRMRVIENITDPAVKSFWVDEFLKYNERYMQEAGDAIKNKIGQFTSNPLIRNIIGQPHSSFDIREIMDDRKIMIMNLSKGLVGEQNANLLGSMLTTRIYLAAMSRADKTPEEMKAAPNFYFYVDEFQSFANATFADILSEARKYKLNLTIAHQYVEQMEEEVRNAVFGNVGTIISFRVGPFDAEILETVFTPKFLAPDIVNLGFAQIYLTLMIDGIGSAPFSAITLPPIENPGATYRDAVIAASRKQFSQKRTGVEEEIHAWHEKSFSNKPPYVPKHLREKADGGDLPNTGENKKKYGVDGVAPKDQQNTSEPAASAPKDQIQGRSQNKPAYKNNNAERPTHGKGDFKNNNNHSGGLKKQGEYKKNTKPPQKEKSAEDLRSVLKNIASEEKGKTNVKKSVKNENARDEQGNLVKDEGALKNALAAALGAAAGASAAKDPDVEKKSEIETLTTHEVQTLSKDDVHQSKMKGGAAQTVQTSFKERKSESGVSPSKKKEYSSPQNHSKKNENTEVRSQQEQGSDPRAVHNAQKADAVIRAASQSDKTHTQEQTRGARDMLRDAVHDTKKESKKAVVHNGGSQENSDRNAAQQRRTHDTSKAQPQSEVVSDGQQKSWKVDQTKQQNQQQQSTAVEEKQPEISETDVHQKQAQKHQDRNNVPREGVAQTGAAGIPGAAYVNKNAVSPQRGAETQNEYALLKNRQTTDPLSPKKLERMMRVTTSDKTPLR